MFQNYPFSTGQATVTGTATLIVAANSSRSGLVITNTSSTVDVYIIENTSGTTLTGQLLPGTKGASLAFTTTGAVYGITGGGSAVLTFLQTQ
jgi:hypothetical protein